MFGKATITLGIGPHSSFYFFTAYAIIHVYCLTNSHVCSLIHCHVILQVAQQIAERGSNTTES